MHRTRPCAATRASQSECNLDGNLVLPDLHSRALDAAQEARPSSTFPAGSMKGSTTKSSKPNISKVLLPQVVMSWLTIGVTVSLARCGSNSCSRRCSLLSPASAGTTMVVKNPNVAVTRAMPRAIRRIFHSRFPTGFLLDTGFCVGIRLCGPPKWNTSKIARPELPARRHVPIVPMSVKVPVLASML